MSRTREVPLYSTIAVGGAHVWVAHHILPMVVRVDPVAREAIDIAVGDKVLDVAVGHGAVWVATTRSLVCVEPERAAVRTVTPMDWTGPNALDGKVAEATIGFDAESVWVAGLFQTSLRRVSPVTAEVTATLAVNRSSLGMAVDHGSVWVRDGDLIRRLDPSTGDVVSTVDPGGRPDRLRLAENGIWVQLGASAGSSFLFFDATSENPIKTITSEGTPYSFEVDAQHLWLLVLSGEADPGNQSTIRRIDAAAPSEVFDIELNTAVWAVAVEDDVAWATTFRHTDADMASGLVRIDKGTGAVEHVFDLNSVDLSPYQPAPVEWPPPRPEDMAVFRCAACGVDISWQVGRLDVVPPIPENEIGEYERLDDWVPIGRYFIELRDALPSEEVHGGAVLNEADIVNTKRDPASWRGCCGADGMDGPNLQCINGHMVALQKSDCFTLNAVWLLPAATHHS